jgi:predicted Zn finger-like uncharacterized protein
MMLTRCPACNTSYRVTAEQLKARAGKVRCGQCSALFDALETLVDTPPAAAAAEAPQTAAASVSAPVPEVLPAAAPPEAAGEETAAAETIDILLEDYEEGTAQASRARKLAWAGAVLISLGLLLVQFAYFFRAELATAQPGLRPQLEELCALLDCDIPLPRQADLVSIEASDLHPDPQRKDLLALEATLKNRAPFAQALPHLELTLTDIRDQPIIRRVFAPAEYLAPGTEASAGFAANGDLAVSLWLEAEESGASGYRLYVFYP